MKKKGESVKEREREKERERGRERKHECLLSYICDSIIDKGHLKQMVNAIGVSSDKSSLMVMKSLFNSGLQSAT